jgi:pimeloyl-[acyl-carrier protein] methyl ester esterase
MSLHVHRSGSGPDLVLLHGWGLHAGVWSGALRELAARFHVHAVDLPGHGRSAAAGFGGLDAAVDLIAREIPDQSIVCGWSMGGMLAQRLALRHRRKARALALVATTPCFVERRGWPHGVKARTLATFAGNLRRDAGATLKAFVTLNAAGSAHGRAALRELAAELSAMGAPHAAVLDAGLSLLERSDLRPEAAAIEQPAVVVHGRRDALVPVEAGRWLASHLGNAHLVEIERAAHLPFITHREEFVRAVASLDG